MTASQRKMHIVPLDVSRPTDDVLSKAVQAFLALFEIATEIVSAEADHSPDISVLAVCADLSPSLLNFSKAKELLGSCPHPVTVLSRHSSAQAFSCSYDKMGLNLFDLPWGIDSNWACYFSFFGLFKFLGSPEQQQLDSNLVCADLQWAQCHELNANLKNTLGHGQRDWLQSAEQCEVSKRLREILKNDQVENLPCKGQCGLVGRLQHLLDNQTIRDEEPTLQWKQKIADLSCGIYRLAQPCLTDSTESPSESTKFSRIIIVEDNPSTKKALKDYLTSYVDPPDEIKLADIEQSVKDVRLSENGRDLLEGIDARKTLVCFDLELKREYPKCRIPDGLRLLYKTVNAHSALPCIVVTGYRSQEHRSLGLRAGSFLLKPFTQEDVNYAVTNAVRHSLVTWFYPKKVQDRDAAVIHKIFAVENIQQRMQKWIGKALDDYLIHLEVHASPLETLYGVGSEDLSNSDLFVLDIAPLDLASEACPRVGAMLRKALLYLRQFNKDAPVIIIWPFDRWKEMDRLLFGSLRRLFRDGMDRILYKPTWLFDYEGSTESLMGQVLHSVELRPSFNIKFTVQLPISPFIGRFDWNYASGSSPEAKSDDARVRFAPFLVPLIKAFGLSAPLSALKNMTEDNKKRLAKAIRSEVMQNQNRWGGFKRDKGAIVGLTDFLLSNRLVQGQESCSQEKEALRALLNELIDELKDSCEIQSYLTLEHWVRSQCFQEIEKHLKDAIRLFGGETRFELFARGSWIDERGTRVEDLLVVVEFLANLSVVSREFVEQQIIQPLLDKYEEEAAILQEIPIRGFLRW